MSVTLPIVGPESVDAIAALCARSIPRAPTVDELSRTLFAEVGFQATPMRGAKPHCRCCIRESPAPGVPNVLLLLATMRPEPVMVSVAAL